MLQISVVVGIIIVLAVAAEIIVGTANSNAHAALDPATVCDRLFNGQVEHVTYRITPRTLAYEQVMPGALHRGYHLTGQQGQKLTFTLQPGGSPAFPEGRVLEAAA